MRKWLAVILYLVMSSAVLTAQVYPKEGSILNYRIIGFSLGAAQQTTKCRLEIAQGNYNSEDSFKKNIIKTLDLDNNKVIAEVPAFGNQYTWRSINIINKKNKEPGHFHHFSTSAIPATDTNVNRLRVLVRSAQYKDAYIFLDGNGVLYDMTGRPVWYLPAIDGFTPDKSDLRDLKLSPFGTITFMYEEKGAYEVNYNGKVLWRAPNNGLVSGTNSEYYHHELTRLTNGHYMILGCEYESWNRMLPSASDSSYKIFHAYKMNPDSAKIRYTTVPFGTIIEYDAQGNVVWSWKSSDYFRNADIYYHQARGGGIAPHENSFYFDEQAHIIYAGFRNISRILKIKYPEGSVTASYGETFKPGTPEAGNGLYCRQHSVQHSQAGYLYLYNNNNCGADGESLPEIIKLEEPASGSGPLKKIWSYQCTVEGVDKGNAIYQFPAGGNVLELAGGALFANMSSLYSKVFILSPDKKILWSAIPEKWNAANKKWEMIYNYRASIITNKKDLETLIWNAEMSD